MERFRAIYPEISAVQVMDDSEDTLKKVKEFVGAEVRFQRAYEQPVLLVNGEPVSIGDWLLQIEEGVFLIQNDADFTTFYTKIDEVQKEVI